MPVTPEQIGELHAFVNDQPDNHGWKIIKLANETYASRHVRITETFGWTFLLIPYGDGSWSAQLTRGHDEKHRGDLDDCRDWLKGQDKRLNLVAQAMRDLDDLADRRRGWNFFDPGKGRYYAGRKFVYPGVDKFLLSISPYRDDQLTRRFCGRVNMPFAGSAEHTVIGDTIGEIEAWAEDWENILMLPIRLADIHDVDEASTMIGKFSHKDLYSLAYLLDVNGGIVEVRRRLFDMFCPAA